MKLYDAKSGKEIGEGDMLTVQRSGGRLTTTPPKGKATAAPAKKADDGKADDGKADDGKADPKAVKRAPKKK